MNDLGKYYLYRHSYVDSGLPFYIGIGTIDRNKNTFKGQYHRAFNKNNRSKLWLNKTKGQKYDVEILFETNDFELIKKKEKEFISLYGNFINRGLLLNLTDGGEGVHGLVGKFNGNSKPVFVYNYEGEFINKFESLLLAEKNLNVSRVSIYNCLKNENHQYLKFVFFKDYKGLKVNPIFKKSRNDKTKKEITVLNLDLSIFKVFESITEASEFFKTGRDTISDNCSKETKTVYKRYYLCYTDDLPNLKVRKPGIRVLKRLKLEEQNKL